MAAVQIATFGSTGANLDVDEIKRIVKEHRLEEIPVVPVAVAGNARTGKTFLLNFMDVYLGLMPKLSGRGLKDAVISGMRWAGGTDGVTKGIWLCKKPFIIKRSDGSEVAILLLDTQGIGDGINSADNTVDEQIISITLSMSTIYMHNARTNWTLSERRIYQICQRFYELYGDGSQQVFNSFILLFRDWSHDEKYGYRPELFEAEKRKCKPTDEAYRILMSIEQLFKRTAVWVLPEPSKALKSCTESININEVGEDFRKEMEDFCSQLFKPNGHFSKHMNSALTGREFTEMVEGLTDLLKRWPKMTTGEEQLKVVYLSNAYKSVMHAFNEASKSFEGKGDMKKFLEEAETSALNTFKRCTAKIKPDDKDYRHYYNKLQKHIEEKKKELITLQAEKSSTLTTLMLAAGLGLVGGIAAPLLSGMSSLATAIPVSGAVTSALSSFTAAMTELGVAGTTQLVSGATSLGLTALEFIASRFPR